MANWTIIAGIAAVLILVIVLYFYFKKTPEKYIKKAVNAHKKGEEYYSMGDTELAEDYYKESEEFRKKAKQLGA